MGELLICMQIRNQLRGSQKVVQDNAGKGFQHAEGSFEGVA